MYAAGIDIGGTHIRIGLVDEQIRLSAFEQFSQKDVLEGNAPQRLAEFVAGYINKNAPGKVKTVCAAFPATVDKNHATVLNAPNISGFNGVNAKAVLQKKLGLPVHIEKDTNALLYYDLYKHKISPDGVTIAVYAGTGLGNAIYAGGRIFEGSNGAAGELGHIPVMDSGEPCSCGNTGCAESFVGGKYLERLQSEAFPDTRLSEIFLKRSEHPLVEQFIRRLASVVAAEINILDPKTVILGGGVVSMRGFPEDKLAGYVRGYARKPLPEAKLKFIFSKNNGENGVIGAGITAWRQL